MTGNQNNGDFEALARQYWNAWGDALRQPGAAPSGQPGPEPAAAPDAGWQQALEWWSRLLPADAHPAAGDAVDRFRQQAGDWYGTMQQVAAQFAGRDTTSADVASAWRQAVEGQGERLMQWTLGSMRAGMPGGPDPWLGQMAEQIERWRRDSAPWLEMPGFGLGRNQHARWQALARAQQDYQAQSQAYAEQLKAALEQAFGLFERKLAGHEGAGSQLTSARAMFDLWIEAAEEAYSAIALSERFREVYGAFANAHMRLRAALQQEVEQICERLGVPTRSEMDAAHRRIAELERLVRRMARGVDTGPAPGATAAAGGARPAAQAEASRGASAGAGAAKRSAGPGAARPKSKPKPAAAKASASGPAAAGVARKTASKRKGTP